MVDSVSSSTNSAKNTKASTGSSIISALGTGSGIDTNALTTQLVDLNKAAQSERLTSKKTLLETQISDFGLLRSSMATLETATAALANKDTFNAKAVSVPETSLMAITKLDAKASAGDYRLKIEQVAQAQSVSSGTFSSPTEPIGKGTLTIRLGEWDAGVNTFSVDTSKTGATITIDDNNNSLTGLRDAINKADIGVTATIVSDSGSYKLLLTSKSGAKNEIEISATETDGSTGLNQFNFNETTQNLTQQQEGLDAQVRVNGLLVNRESNHITDVVEGLEFDIFSSSTTETVSLVITEDKTIAETAIRDFVSAYNTFLTEAEQLIGFNTESKEYGSLRKDPLAKALLQNLRSNIAAAVPGIEGDFSALSSLGIRTELNGSLKIVEDEGNTGFRAAIDNNFELVRDLFVPKTSATTTGIEVTKFGAKSVPGTYDVVITQQPSKGKLTAGVVASTFPLDTTGKDYSFKFSLDGVSTSTITLPSDKTYNSAEEVAAEIQSLINLDPAVKAVKGSVSVTHNTTSNKFVFVSDAYGTSSTVGFTEVGADMADLGIGISAGAPGTNVAGTVNGEVAFGLGNVLLPSLGSEAEGLSMLIQPGTTSGQITFSRGFAGGMTNLINDYLKTSGLIKNRETTLENDIQKVDKDVDALDRRSEAYRARLQAQFSAMESIVRSLNSTGDFLDGILDRLPFTANSG